MILVLVIILFIICVIIGLSVYYYYYFIKKIVKELEDIVEDEKPKFVLNNKKDKDELLSIYEDAVSALSINEEDFYEIYKNSDSDLDFLENIGKDFYPVLYYAKYIEDNKSYFYDLDLKNDMTNINPSFIIYASELYYKFPLEVNKFLSAS